MGAPSTPLIEHQEWAKLALEHVEEQVGHTNSLLWASKPFASSSMFSGLACPERALAFISAARSSHSQSFGALTGVWAQAENG